MESKDFVLCQCGCGTPIPATNKLGHPARFKHGHNGSGANTRFKKGQTPWIKGKKHPNPRSFTTEDRAKAAEGRRRYIDSLPKFCTIEGCEKPVRQKGLCDMHYIRVRKHGDPNFVADRSGPNNSFFGKKHTDETRQKMSAKKQGPLHNAWRGGAGYKPYGAGFTRKLRALIRERDGFTCQRCGKTQEQEGRTLEVHHLDHDKNNHDPANLATSCHSCNVWASFHRDEPWLGGAL